MTVMKHIAQRNLFKLLSFIPALFIGACPLSIRAQEEFIKLNADIEMSGVPPIPKSLANDVRRYSFIFGTPLAGWAPDKREIWTKSISSHTVISSIKAPGEMPKTYKFLNGAGIYDLYIQPQARYLIYNQDKDGTEKFQMYLYDMQNGKTTFLSDGNGRDTEFVWSNSGEQVAYSSTVGGKGVSL